MSKRGLIIVLLISAAIILSGCLIPSPPGGEGDGSSDEEGWLSDAEESETDDSADVELPSQYHYVMKFSSSDESDAGGMEVWVEDDYERVDFEDDDGKIIFLTTPEGTCLYDSSSDEPAMMFPAELGGAMNPAAAWGMWFGSYYYGEETSGEEMVTAMRDFCKYNPTCDSVDLLGYETIAGHKCVGIKKVYTEGVGTATIEMWFATEYGYLMKLEIKDEDGTVTTMEFTEVDIDKDIPDSVFSIPECENAQSIEEMFGDMEGFVD